MTRRKPTPKPFLTLPEAAALLGIPRQTAWSRVKATGHLYEIPAIQATPTRYVVSRKAVERLLADRDDDR